MTPPEVIEDWLSQCENQFTKLSKWEQDFVESLREQFTQRGRLSEKQLEILERIYAEKC